MASLINEDIFENKEKPRLEDQARVRRYPSNGNNFVGIQYL